MSSGAEMPAMSEQGLVYVSVLNWNGVLKTTRCLRSLESIEYARMKILVVDNASCDGSVESLSGDFPEIEIISSTENLGYAGGHLLSARRALADGADYLWIVNNDLVFDPQALGRLVAAHGTLGEGLFGSVPLSEHAAVGPESRVEFDAKFFRVPFREVSFGLRRERCLGELFPTSEPRRVAAVAGCSFLIPADVLQNRGFMDVEYFLYAEEVEYCLRLDRAGVRSWMVPGSLVFHEVGGSTSTNPLLRGVADYYLSRNQIDRVRRHSGWVALAVCLLGSVILRVLLPALRGGIAVRTARWSLLGIRDGLLGRLGKTMAPEDYYERKQAVEP